MVKKNSYSDRFRRIPGKSFDGSPRRSDGFGSGCFRVGTRYGIETGVDVGW